MEWIGLGWAGLDSRSIREGSSLCLLPCWLGNSLTLVFGSTIPVSRQFGGSIWVFSSALNFLSPRRHACAPLSLP